MKSPTSLPPKMTSKGPKVDPRKKENQIAAMCVAADEPKCTGGLRMIKERANNKNLPLLFAGWSYPILLAMLIFIKLTVECRLNLGMVGAHCALLGVAHAHKVTF